ncbi:MAG: ATP-binding cassette domain-containing protein [Oscillospiraceae bacterium]|nr:ATP-binding cassette domain-containing protein [Oscillospiraceae bacterium]
MDNFDSVFVRTSWEILDVLHQTQTTADGLAECLDILCKAFSCDQGSIWVLGKSGQFLYALAQRGSANLAGVKIATESGITGQAVASGQILQADKSSCEREFCAEEKDACLPEGSLLWVPLKTPSAVMGCIQLGGRENGGFEERDINACKRYGAIIALDLEERGMDRLPDTDQKIIASLKDVVKDYGTENSLTHVLKKVTLDVYENEILVILGESGSGKSTLLNILGCMTPLTFGHLEVDGQDLSALSERELTEFRRSSIGFVFQAYNLMPNLTARENVQIISELSAHPMDPDQALEMVGLSERADHLPAALSGGQQQRVAIARAVAKSPRIILADEPTAALDYKTGKEVLTVLQDVVRNQKTTLIIVTHNIEIAKIANRVVHLKDGRVSGIRVNLSPMQASLLVW